MSYAVFHENPTIARLLGRPRSALDVGCGEGQNGAIVRRRGAHVVGVDGDGAALRRAARRLDRALSVDLARAGALPRALEDVAPPEGFDLAIVADVLEHVADPERLLREVSASLADGGHVVVSVPNVAAWPVRAKLLAGRFDYEPSGVLDATHLRFFTRRSLLELVRGVGLEVLTTDLTPMLSRAAFRAPLARAAGRKRAPGALSEEGHVDEPEPEDLDRTWLYALYREFAFPFERRVAHLAPGLAAFQHVVVARRRPAPGPASLVVGMLTMDEEASVEPTLAGIRRVAPDARILCVDSSTRDRTPEIARALGATVLRQVPARGHGPAMELLLREAERTADLLITLDCDGTYPIDAIPRLRALLEAGADVVDGSRTGSRPEAMPFANYFANRVFAGAAHALHGAPVVDVHSGMRGYRTSVLRAFDFDGEGDALPVETLLAPIRRGYEVVSVPIDYAERVGASKLRKLSGTAWTFARLASLFATGARGPARFRRLTR
jgi:SAM-dependent methyltransferase